MITMRSPVYSKKQKYDSNVYRSAEGAMVNQETQGSIVVVDDQPANLKLMEDMLKQQGYAVRSFPRGRMALAAVGEQSPDLILLDINMPEMNGFEVCERLKADKNLASIPVIFLNALNETEGKIKAFQCGGVDYVTKPFQFEEVQARVETHLKLQRARRSERDLLENTLNGAIRALAGLVQLTGPALSARTDAIRSIVAHIATRLSVEDRWEYDLAASLCLIGVLRCRSRCLSVPMAARRYLRRKSRCFEIILKMARGFWPTFHDSGTSLR
jgi:CheY-like chemotaxis protein